MNQGDKGYFVTFEGGEGAGKSTQIKKLSDLLSTKGYDVVTTREPGGTPGGEKIRDLLCDPDFGPHWPPHAELMLLYAARAAHLDAVIRPALERGAIVLCDRFVDSTAVYQGYLQKLNPDFLSALEKEIIGTEKPNITFILDLPVKAGMERVHERGGAKDHYDKGEKEVHETIRQGFLDIAERNPERCINIDADRTVEEVAADIEKIMLERLNV